MRLSIIGSGPGGYVAAIKAAQSGVHVTVIEDREVGGTCLNWGCIPTKTLVASAEVLSKTRRLEHFGIELNGTVTPNLSRIIDRKNKVISTQVKGIRGLFKIWGVTLKHGRGTLISPKQIEVTSSDGSKEIVESDKIIIATGSRPAGLPNHPFDGTKVISSTEALDLREIPKSLIIVGAGVIGCEFACIYRELGTEVTIVEMLPRVLATEDWEISDLFKKELKKKKINLITDTKVNKVNILDNGVSVLLSDERELFAEKLLVSTGRKLNSDGIGLEKVGIHTNANGGIAANNRMETNAPGVYAIGDVTGRTLLAHIASREGVVAARNIAGIEDTIDYRFIPAAIFTSPEIGSVGMREHEAAEKGIKYKTGHFPFRALGKAHAIDEINGFIKIISEESSSRILGAHIIGPHASDLIHEAAVAIKAGLTVKDIAETIHAHPTLSEGLMEAAGDALGEAVHVARNSAGA